MTGLENPDRNNVKKQTGRSRQVDSLKVLLVEDNPGDARLIKEMLSIAKDAIFEVICADRLSTGLEHISNGGIDVILLDLH